MYTLDLDLFGLLLTWASLLIMMCGMLTVSSAWGLLVGLFCDWWYP